MMIAIIHSISIIIAVDSNQHECHNLDDVGEVDEDEYQEEGNL